MTATARDWALLTGLGILWGASFMATKVATEDFGPFSIAAIRLAVAAVALAGLRRLRGWALPGLSAPEDRRFWRFALGVAVLSNVVPFTALGWGQRYVDSALAGVFMASVPLFVLPLGHFLVPGERMTPRRVAGFLLGFAGVVALIGPSALAGIGGGGTLALLAQGACLLAAFGYASGSVTAKLAPQRGLIVFGSAAMMLAALLAVPLAVALDRPFAEVPSVEGLAAVIYLGLGPTALATVMLLTVIASAGPGFLALVNYQVPVWAVVFGALVLGESLSPRLGIALAMILCGLALAQARLGVRRGGHARG